MAKTITDIPVLVYGATFTGIGIAMENPEHVLIVDRKALVGHEFIDAYNAGSEKKWSAVSKHGKNLKQELIKRKILSPEGEVHIPAASPVLCKMMLDYGLKTLMMTTVYKIEKSDGGYRVTYFNNSGFHTLNAGRIIDTTSQGLLSGKADGRVYARSINAALTPISGAVFPFEKAAEYSGDFTCTKGLKDGEVYLKLKLGMDEDWAAVRQRLHGFWQNRPACLSDWQLAAVASTFDYTVEKGPVTDDMGIAWLPSCAYGDPLEAFEEGVAWMKGGVA